jgi:hypothetical protein
MVLNNNITTIRELIAEMAPAKPEATFVVDTETGPFRQLQ